MGYNGLFNNLIHSVSDSYMGLRRIGLRRAKTIRYNLCFLRLLLQTRHHVDSDNRAETHVDSDNRAETCAAPCLCARQAGWVRLLMLRSTPGKSPPPSL